MRQQRRLGVLPTCLLAPGCRLGLLYVCMIGSGSVYMALCVYITCTEWFRLVLLTCLLSAALTASEFHSGTACLKRPRT